MTTPTRTPAGRLLAVALLDCTIKVFFADSLKFWLSLYGHKLPVLSMDISSDSQLLASGSADKNLKVRLYFIIQVRVLGSQALTSRPTTVRFLVWERHLMKQGNLPGFPCC